MPHAVQAILTTTSGMFPHDTVTPESFVFTLEDGVSVAIEVPYTPTSPVQATFPASPEGTWIGTAKLKLPDGTFIGATATGTVIVPPDSIPLQQPVALTLAVS